MAVHVVVGDKRADAAHEVGEGGYRGPRDDVVRAGILTHPNRADRHALHRAGDGPDSNQIAGIHAVFELNKNPGNNILHQGLRAERHRQPQCACACQ